ncbi:hypothetical protein GCM10009120_27600 [Sphingobacterium siyangense subsp. cladoniae]
MAIQSIISKLIFLSLKSHNNLKLNNTNSLEVFSVIIFSLKETLRLFKQNNKTKDTYYPKLINMQSKRKKEDHNAAKPPFKERLQMAVASILEGRLFIEEAVEKYEILPSSIIQELRRIQKLKKSTTLSDKKSK